MHTQRCKIKNKFPLEYDFHRLILFPVGKFRPIHISKYFHLLPFRRGVREGLVFVLTEIG